MYLRWNRKPQDQPITQEKRPRTRWPAFAKEFPRWGIKPDPEFQLIPQDKLDAKLDSVDDPAIKEQIRHQMDLLERELMPLFRERDTRAKVHQNRYRKFQILFIVLALIATVIGSLQGLAREYETWLGLFAFCETIVALFAFLVASVDRHNPPLARWIRDRRFAEGLRQEYFRYLMYASPYDQGDVADRDMLLARRAAEINQGSHPQTTSGTGD